MYDSFDGRVAIYVGICSQALGMLDVVAAPSKEEAKSDFDDMSEEVYGYNGLPCAD